jgi:hypothetical protein
MHQERVLAVLILYTDVLQKQQQQLLATTEIFIPVRPTHSSSLHVYCIIVYTPAIHYTYMHSTM